MTISIKPDLIFTMTFQKKMITVLGAGSWGSALAMLLARQGYPVLLWGKNTQQLQEMAKKLPPSIKICLDLKEAVMHAQDILIMVPSWAFHEILLKIKPFLHPKARLVWGTKGLDPKTGYFLHQLVAEILGSERRMGILSGPSFAEEVAKGQPTAVAFASSSAELAKDWAQYLHGQTFRVYPTTDMIGVELAGIVKNILAIASGIAEGLGFGANTKAALTTRGLAEMMRLGLCLGGNQMTFLGLAGVGDLVLTSYSEQSRNRRLGLAIGQGVPLPEAKRMVGSVIEGAQNAKLIYHLARKHKIEMPICEQVYHILYQGLDPRKAVETLLSRTPLWNLEYPSCP